MEIKLEVFVTTYNNEHIIQDFIDWYRAIIPDCPILVYDNESTDKTVEICKQNNCRVISFSTGGKMDEQTLINIRNSCWKNSKAKFCCVVDSDELVDVSLDILNREDWNVCKCKGFEMFGVEGDKLEDLIYGCPSAGYGKSTLFRKSEIKEMNFAAGSHTCSPKAKEGYSVKWIKDEVNLYHTKWRSYSHGIGKAHEIAPRVSEASKRIGWNFHYALEDSVHKDYYMQGFNTREKVRYNDKK